MNAGMNASVSGNNVETITYSIEGEGAYLETISDDPPTQGQEEIDASEDGRSDVLPYSELQRAKSFTLDYREVALEDGTQLSDVPTILSIYLKVPVPETVLANWDAMNDADDFDTFRDAEIDFHKNIDIAGSQVLSTCRLTLTATFTDGTTQTKTYAIGVVDDCEQRIAAYWDAVDESGRAYDRAMVNGEEPTEEAYEKADNRPEEPALYTLTEIQ